MRIVGQSPAAERRRVWVAAGATYGVAAFAPALDAGRAPSDPSLSVVPFCVVFALAFVPWGRWTDRHGVAPAMRAASALLLLAGVVLVLPLGDAGWIAGRALEGLAAAGVPPAAQAALAALGGAGRTGRAIGGMSVAVAVGTLLVPLLAGAFEPILGTDAVLALGALGLPVIALVAVTPLLRSRRLPTGGAARARRLPVTSGLWAAWACAFLVLIAYWTIVTRIAPLLGPDGAGLSEDGARAIPLLGGVAGMLLTGVVAGVADRIGPRRPMVAVLATGVTGLLIGALTGTPGGAALGIGLFALAYWCYLTLVGLQVVLAVPQAVRGHALGGLYAAMWSGAAVGGALAALVDAWTTVLVLSALAWACAAIVAARWFAGPRGVAGAPPHPAAVSTGDVPVVAR
ncbi:MFS transporter [Paraconexibacter sp.]|uniref:MFS transporter n=1 Tax=Paraconexibacter sp. TaxID=2949640 RepID=UPI003567CADA